MVFDAIYDEYEKRIIEEFKHSKSGEEVSADVIDSGYFVGYDFKKYLLEVQQAIIVYCLS